MWLLLAGGEEVGVIGLLRSQYGKLKIVQVLDLFTGYRLRLTLTFSCPPPRPRWTTVAGLQEPDCIAPAYFTEHAETACNATSRNLVSSPSATNTTTMPMPTDYHPDRPHQPHRRQRKKKKRCASPGPSQLRPRAPLSQGNEVKHIISRTTPNAKPPVSRRGFEPRSARRRRVFDKSTRMPRPI